MLKIKIDKNTLYTVLTIVTSVFAGVFFIVWIINLLSYPVISFHLIAIPIIMLYYFSGYIYSAILTYISVIMGILSIIFFIGNKPEVYIILLECLFIICIYLILKMYRKKYIFIERKFFEECDIFNKEIAIKECEILENNKRINNLSQQIKRLRKIGRILQSFPESLTEHEFIFRTEYIVHRFIGKGIWKLKQYQNNDIFASYMKSTSLPLMIENIFKDNRFPLKRHKSNTSLIAAPIEFNGIFWGTIQGTSRNKGFFSQEDLKQLSLLAGTISVVFNNFYLYNQLQKLAITDGLTGLYTHIYFNERIKEELNRSQSNSLSLSLAIVDIDFFKSINDKYGHLAGDSILRQISSILKIKLRETDFIARYGGDEFALIMIHTSSQEVGKVLEKIRLIIETEKFFLSVENLFSMQISVTISAGFVSLDKKVDISTREFIENADKALYKAKHSGRNKVEEYIYE